MSEDSSRNHYSSATHQRLQHSSTLNRRYVQRPEPVVKHEARESEETKEAVAISSFAKCQAENLRRRQELAEKINQERLAMLRQKRIEREMAAEVEEPVENCDEIVEKPVDKSVENSVEKSAAKKAQQMKDEAIRRAMRSVASMEAEEKKSRRHKKRMGVKSRGRMALAIASAVAVVGAIGYFVSVNLPDVSVQVTALQSGIDNPYPSYVPRGFTMVTSMGGDNSVSMTFANGDDTFVLTEEKSAWDSKTLLTNYVETKWRSYDTLKEQGTTIYISGSSAAWVNNGIKYTIDAKSGVLTNKQIKSIALSL